MKQIVFISGKGGTGKSTLTASLSRIVQNKAIADCDVEAPNLHILMGGQVVEQKDFYGAEEAVINKEKCTSCNICRETCRFDAIDEDFEIIPFRCEGCGACALVCPADAIRLEKVKTGETYVSKTSRGTFSHALLDIGAEGSGRLVTEVRNNMKKHADKEDWILIDGSPGIGCVVIASITGADAVVAVAEPTKSGISDLERVLAVARHFEIPAYVCINKYDINLKITKQIEDFCEKNNFEVIGRIPFEPKIVNALRDLKTPIDADIPNIAFEIESIWKRLADKLSESDKKGDAAAASRS
ncbi:MAG: 4Fe-4S binding protein [Clostridiales bacterium]|jgi:MinD superfamily P-loop ATPase|nr:4Fe-4S binding protein [Clostridiales bacterium]